MPRVHHAGLTVSSLDRALAFWRDALGMVEVFQQEKTGGYLGRIVGEPEANVRMAHLAFAGDEARVELFEYIEPAGEALRPRPQDVGFAHICVACADIDGVLERPAAAGGEPVSAPVEVDTGANRGGRAVYVRDPDGHVVELFTPPKPVEP